eukprot:11784702-Alexandrium_andersonii.AAC.1
MAIDLAVVWPGRVPALLAAACRARRATALGHGWPLQVWWSRHPPGKQAERVISRALDSRAVL